MVDPKKEIHESVSIAEDLLKLYDEVAEFTDCCAFLCDSFSSLAGKGEPLDSSTIDGFNCLSNWMKRRMAEVKYQLRTIQEKCYSEMEKKE